MTIRVLFLITCVLVLGRVIVRDLGTNLVPETIANSRIIINEVTVGSTTIGPSDYPYMPWYMLSECGFTTASDLSLVQPKPLNQSLAFIKPYKVGSSTVANLVNRWADYRDLPRMIPKPASESVMGRTPTGKPDTFPGPIIPTVPVGVKYRALTNHAVFFNRSLLSKYMEDPITTFTIMREPLSRVKSAYRFFKCGKGSYKRWTSSEIINSTAQIEKWGDHHRVQKWKQAVCGNGLAYSLGWYHQNNFTTQYDRDVHKIEAFIKNLDDQMDMVMMLDRLEESLLLLRDILPGLAVPELVYNRFKDNRKGDLGIKKVDIVVPTASEMKELEDILLVDKMIYNHFSKRFDEQWKSLVRRSTDMESIKQSLICLQGKVEANMDNADVFHEDLIKILNLDSKKFTIRSKEKQSEILKQQVENGMKLQGTIPPTSGTSITSSSSGTTTDDESTDNKSDEGTSGTTTGDEST